MEQTVQQERRIHVIPATKQAAASTAPFTPTNATINAITPDAPIDCARP